MVVLARVVRFQQKRVSHFTEKPSDISHHHDGGPAASSCKQSNPCMHELRTSTAPYSFNTMWMRFTYEIAIFAFAIVPCNGSTDIGGSLTIYDLQRVHVPNRNELRPRIKVPTQTRLLDAINDTTDERSQTRRRNNDRTKQRQFSIEAHDQHSQSISTLNLNEVPMAITPQTTYKFKSNRNFDSANINYSILASHSKDQMTILSIDKQSGRVRGLQRENGRAKYVFDEEDRLHMRLLEKVEREKEWTCGALTHDHEEYDLSTSRDNVFDGGAAGAAVRKQNFDDDAEPVGTWFDYASIALMMQTIS